MGTPLRSTAEFREVMESLDGPTQGSHDLAASHGRSRV